MISYFPFSGKIFIVHAQLFLPIINQNLGKKIKIPKHLPSDQTLAMSWIEPALDGRGTSNITPPGNSPKIPNPVHKPK